MSSAASAVRRCLRLLAVVAAMAKKMWRPKIRIVAKLTTLVARKKIYFHTHGQVAAVRRRAAGAAPQWPARLAVLVGKHWLDGGRGWRTAMDCVADAGAGRA